MKTKIEFLIKHNAIIQFFYRFIFSFIFRFIGLFVKINPNMILFSSFGGKLYNDSPRLIYERIKEKYGDKFQYVWAFLDPTKHQNLDCTCIKINSFKYFIYALKSKYWVTNVNIERGLSFKRKGNIYLNTWHGVCLDYIGNDRPGRKDYNFKDIDFLCVSSAFDEKIYKTAFNASKKNYLYCGMPRNDLIINSSFEQILNLKKQLGIPLDKKVILFAPTWRENLKTKDTSKIESPLSITKWKQILGDEYCVIFRAHSMTREVLNITFDDFCINVSDYPEANELLPLADIIISDYSSILIDYALLERPIFNLGIDYDDFSKEHGFYEDYEKEMPNGMIRSEDVLLDKIININFEEEKNKTIKLKNKFLTYQSPKSTDVCIDALLSK